MDSYGENGFFSFMNRLGDIFFLNLLFILTCLPVITIGPALTALYSISLKMAKGQEGYVIRGYIKAFKDNLRQGLIVGIVLEIIIFVLAYDAWALLHSSAGYSSIGFLVTIAALVFIVMVIQYVFALIARYENGIKNTVRNAVLLAVSKLPYTLILVLLAVLPAVLVYFSMYALIYVIFGGFSVSALLQGKILNRVFEAVENSLADNNS